MEYGLVALWFTLYVGLSLAALPFASLLFKRFADRGAGLALPLALATLGVIGYWVGRVSFGLPAAVAGVVVLLGASAYAYRRGVVFEWRRYRDVMLVFALAFGFMLAIRAFDPAAHPGGGEKFLDLGLLSSLVRSTSLPPEDMWFAGEPVKYYYGGHMVAALLAELTGTAPEYAYNLALSGYFASLVSAAYGLAGAIAADRRLSYGTAGAFAAFFVGFASNLSTPARFLGWVLPAGDSIASLLGVAGARFCESPVPDPGVGECTTLVYGPKNFGYWDASGGLVSGIHEFPLFAWLNGDLHAHMMSTTFLVLVAGLLFSYWQTPASSLRRRRGLVLGAVPLVGGFLAVVNTWSFATVAGLTWLSLSLAPAEPWTLLSASLDDVFDRVDERLDRELARTLVALVVAVVVAVVGVVVAAPFFAGMVLSSGSERSIALLPPRSGLFDLLWVHGAFLAVAVAYLLHRLDLSGHRFRVVVLIGLLVGVAGLGNLAAIGVVLPVLVFTWILARTRADVGFEGVLVVAATGLILLVEFVYVSEQAGPGRMNTVFKTYSQVWILFAIGAGAMLTDVASRARAWSTSGTDALSRPLSYVLGTVTVAVFVGAVVAAVASLPLQLYVRAWVGLGVVGAVGWATTVDRPFRTLSENAGVVLALVLVVSLPVYGVLALGGQYATARPDPTLDATAFVDDRHPDEAAAIEWVDSLDGQPTIVTAPGTSMYRWSSPVSSLTGVPTLVGWHHEVGYRGKEAFWGRVKDVDAIYTGTPDQQARLLAEYDVEYVYVGPLERGRYGDVSVDELDAVTPVKRLGSVVIYRVEREKL